LDTWIIVAPYKYLRKSPSEANCQVSNKAFDKEGG